MPGIDALQKRDGASLMTPSKLKLRSRLFGSLLIAFMLATPQHSLGRISDQDEQRLDDFITQMTIKELLGQTLILGYHAQVAKNLATQSKEGLERLLDEYSPGGVILFRHNFAWRKNEKELRKFIWGLTDSLQDAAFESQPESRKIPLMIAIDQEGAAKWNLKTPLRELLIQCILVPHVRPISPWKLARSLARN